MNFPKGLLAAAISCSLASQFTVANDSTDTNSFTLEEIVVSARKIEESAQDIPVAINVMDGTTVEDLKIENMTDVIKFTPGATFTSSFAGEPNISVRGISSGDNSASGSSGVLLMADNEVIAREFMYSGALFDIARVEVLRGPQGTTYGKNANGGVVHTISNLPTEEREVKLKTTLGNYDLVGLEGVMGGAVSESVSARLAVYNQEREGYSEDALTGKSVDDTDTQAIKASLVWDASDDLSVTFRGHWSKDNYANPAPRKALDPSLPDGLSFNPAIGSSDTSTDPYKVMNSDNQFYDRTIWGGSVEAVLALDGYDLTSITSYRKGDDNVRIDLFGSYDDLLVQRSENDASTFSQEFRFDNGSQAESLTWLLGLYYLDEEHAREETKEVLANDPVFQSLGLETFQNFSQDSSGYSLGAFGEVNYDFTENTRLTVGARYSYEKKDYEVTHGVTGGTFLIPGGGGASFTHIFIDDPSQVIDEETDETWDSVTGKVSLTHNFLVDALVYFTVANGFKAGGFNPEPANAEAAVQSYDEETLVSMELGVKAELLDRRLRLNAAIFDSSYDDIQTEGFLPSGAIVVENAGEASIQGLELEFTWLVLENLTLMGSYANYESEYKELNTGGVDLKGEVLTDVPEWTGHLGAIYQVDLEDSSNIRLRVDYRSRADVLAIRDEVVGDVKRPGEDIFSAQASWTSADEAWEVALWGENLTDKAEVAIVGPSALGTQPHVTYSAPRTFGMTVTYNMQ